MSQNIVFTLFSSDSSQQYKKDVLNVVAAPFNSEYRFRYKKEYIEEAAEVSLKDKKSKGKWALIVFRTNSDKKDIEPFMVPIRWCKIKEIDYENDICIITFVVKGYPEFDSEFAKACVTREKNIGYTKKYFEEKNINKFYVLPYPIKAARVESIGSKNHSKNWVNISEALNKHEVFENTLFFQTILPSKSGKLKITEYAQKTVTLSHYCCEDTDNYSASLSIACNEDLIQLVTEERLPLDCRYDKVPHVFEAKKSSGYSTSQVIFNIKANNNGSTTQDETKIIVPVKIRRRWPKRIIKTILSIASVISLTVIASWTTFSGTTLEKDIWIYILLIIAALASPMSNLFLGEG